MLKAIILILATLLCFDSSSQAQKLKHYFTYSTVPYINLFNKEKEKFPIRYVLALPAFNYKLEKGRMGIELFFIHNETSYNRIYDYHPLPNPDINRRTIDMYSVGLTFQYKAFERKWIKINPNIGLTYHWYQSTVFISSTGRWLEPYINGQKESKLGAVVGLNINFPVYKGFYANTNIRYSVFPTANYNKQNLIWEIGIGYLLYRK